MRAQATGATFLQGTATSIDANRVVLADGTVLHAGAIVIAAGTGSIRLIPALPIVPRKGHLIITNRRPGMVHHQLVELGYLASAHGMGAASVAFNVQPRPGGQLLVGSSRELVGFDASINRELCGRMLARATSMLPDLATAAVWRTWTGFRPATPDSLPLIGKWLPADGVWIAAGHEGLGITMAPGTADLITASIMGTALPLDITPFDPCRAMPVHEAFA
jgi:glycine/D-amino acid oxidase-like deaminating enzyme